MAPDPKDILRLVDNADNEDQRTAIIAMLRDKALSQLHFFNFYVCMFPDIATKFHKEMCDRWQARINREFTLWLLPRKHTKTSCFSVGGTLWEACRDPDLTQCISNAKYDIAEKILDEIRVIRDTSEVFAILFPEYRMDSSIHPRDVLKRSKNRNDRLDFPCSKQAGKKTGNIELLSVGSGRTSQHYKRITHDDVVNEDNCTTREFRDKIYDWIRNSYQLRFDLHSPVRVIGTRWHYDDAYGRFIKQEKALRKQQQDANQPVDPRWLIYRRKIIENEEPIWPERFQLPDIEQLKRDTGSYIFACQYMNEPVPEEDAIFKLSNIRHIGELDVPHEVVNFAAIDMAVNDEVSVRSDYNVMTVASFDVAGKMYIVDIIRGKFSVLDFVEDIYRAVKKWDLRKVGVETHIFQKVILTHYKRVAAEKGYNIPWVELDGGNVSKLKRGIGFQPRVERGDFAVLADLPNVEDLIEEMTLFPLAPHDDIMDTLIYLEQIFYGAPKVFDVPKPKFLTYDSFLNNVLGISMDDDKVTSKPIPIGGYLF